MYLDKIVAKKKQDQAFLEASKKDWVSCLAEASLPKRSFTESLKSGTESGGLSIIAEMKRASPSKGSFEYSGSVADQVRRYDSGGARAVSVLTDRPFFQGGLDDLKAARSATELPLLRKDFLTEGWEVPQARYYGADAILLIAAILSDQQLAQMIEEATRWDLEVLLEVHSDEELDRVLALPKLPNAIGINNRDLNTFEVDLDTTTRLVKRIPKEICRISESGFSTRSDLKRFEGIVDAFLIGESLMRADDPEQTLREWVKG